jgi:tRNA(Ile)-lysidine synthase TilS/MesJ
MHLCREHFEEDVRRKIRETLRKTGLFGRDARIALGLDGGRKSAALAFVLKNLFIRRRDIDLLAVIIDEGKETSSAADQARQVAEQLSLPYVAKGLPPLPDQESSYFAHTSRKRKLLFCTAKENDASILATGETLDDEALDIFIGYLRGDADAVISDGLESKEQNVAWIKPLRRIPEKEVRLYAIGHGLGFPNVGGMHNTDALRGVAKGLLCGFDRRHPGTNYSLQRGQEKGAAQEGVGKGKAFK